MNVSTRHGLDQGPSGGGEPAVARRAWFQRPRPRPVVAGAEVPPAPNHDQAAVYHGCHRPGPAPFPGRSTYPISPGPASNAPKAPSSSDSFRRYDVPAASGLSPLPTRPPGKVTPQALARGVGPRRDEAGDAPPCAVMDVAPHTAHPMGTGCPPAGPAPQKKKTPFPHILPVIRAKSSGSPH